MILPLSALAFAALSESTIDENYSKIKDIIEPVLERALPTIEYWPYIGRSNARELCYAMSQFARLNVCEHFFASRVHKTLKRLRNRSFRDDEHADATIKLTIRTMPVFRTLGGRKLLAKMANPNYYANLTDEDTRDDDYKFLGCMSHMGHMHVLADLAATSFYYDNSDEYFTVRAQDINRHLEVLRVDIAPSKRRRLW